MKAIFTCLALLLGQQAYSQSGFPGFLQGTWKVDGKESYEHWDSLNPQTLQGFAYTLKNGLFMVSEYLEISRKGGKLFYSATVLNQNQGKAVQFKCTRADSTFVFENPSHDFPKQIIYKVLSQSEVYVKVSDGKQKGFSYKMARQNPGKTAEPEASSNPNYDKELATKLGGDDYGMKNYYFVILKTGPNTSTDKAFINESFRGHFDNIQQLVKEEKLILAGPLGKNDNQYRGIFILNNVGSIEEANELLQSDPAIKNGLLDVEIYKWYGSAALPEYLPFSDKIWKSKP